MKPTVTVLGSGYVGLTTASLLAGAGFATYIIDPNPKRLESIKKGKSFFYEEGLDNLVAHVIKNGALIPTESYKLAIPKSDFIFSAVGTPDKPDGSSNLTYIFASASEAIKYLRDDAVYIQKSTVPVGTGAQVMKLFKEANLKTSYVSNPEFLRESTALLDSLWFDRIVFGGNNKKSLEKVIGLYEQIRQSRDAIVEIAGIKPSDKISCEQYITTTLASAELIKVTANAFLSLKISFANSIAKLADKTGADVIEVMDAVGADSRIGKAFLNAGRGYGGGCFPKDVSGLIASGLEFGETLPILEAAQSVNGSMPGYIIEKLRDEMGDDLADKQIAVLGLSFKAGTSDVRRSPSIVLANILADAGAKVSAFDPQALEEARADTDPRVALKTSVSSAIKGAEAVIIATDWPEFLLITPSDFAKEMKGKVFVDAMNRFDPKSIKSAGLKYIGVGRS